MFIAPPRRPCCRIEIIGDRSLRRKQEGAERLRTARHRPKSRRPVPNDAVACWFRAPAPEFHLCVASPVPASRDQWESGADRP
ncbi:MAG: hypothetical protein R3184_11215, partial [Aurantimonas coralicida]|nr:hypothetical protein [Aurantimonas coralicida]